MDAVEYSEERFEDIKTQLTVYLKRVGYNPKSVAYVPTSGLYGTNLLETSEDLFWYKGTSFEYQDEMKKRHSL